MNNYNYNFKPGHVYRFRERTTTRTKKPAQLNQFYSGMSWDEFSCEFEFIAQSGKMYQFREIHGLWTRTLSHNQLISYSIYVRDEKGSYSLFA